MTTPRHIVAIDMGSNSFHLIIAREQDGQLQILHKEKQQVKLAQGLNEANVLSEEAIARGVACLQDFYQRFANIHHAKIRLVATNTLRVASNRQQFLSRAFAVLPHPIEIISGHEEARLIYYGISQSEVLGERNLVIDIGGGSTEVIVGHQQQPIALSSVQCGCVSFHERFFSDGKITQAQFKAAIAAADNTFGELSQVYFDDHWQLVLGSSGTVKAINEALNELYGDETITLKGLKKLKDQLIDWGYLDKQLTRIDERRASILAAGLAVLIGFFQRLSIESMQHTNSALREGVLYEMTQIGNHTDVRQRTVESLAKLYHVDQLHAQQVKEHALALFAQVAEPWQLTTADADLLRYAARLHEIGIHINSKGHQKHGYYIIAHADLPGFDEATQQQLALLIGNQRKRPAEELADNQQLIKLVVLLRLAVVINRGRQGQRLLPNIRARDNAIQVQLPDYSEHASLLIEDLQREIKAFQHLGIELMLETLTS